MGYFVAKVYVIASDSHFLHGAKQSLPMDFVLPFQRRLDDQQAEEIASSAEIKSEILLAMTEEGLLRFKSLRHTSADDFTNLAIKKPSIS